MKRLLSRVLVVSLTLGLSSLALAQQKAEEKVTITGWMTDTDCGASGANAEHAKIAEKCVKEKGAKWAIYNPEDKTLYILADQEKGPKMLGKKVIVKGTMEKNKKEVKVDTWNFV